MPIGDVIPAYPALVGPNAGLIDEEGIPPRLWDMCCWRWCCEEDDCKERGSLTAEFPRPEFTPEELDKEGDDCSCAIPAADPTEEGGSELGFKD